MLFNRIIRLPSVCSQQAYKACFLFRSKASYASDFLSHTVEFKFSIRFFELPLSSACKRQNCSIGKLYTVIGYRLKGVKINCYSFVGRTEVTVNIQKFFKITLTYTYTVAVLITDVYDYGVIIVFGVQNLSKYDAFAVRKVYNSCFFNDIQIKTAEHSGNTFLCNRFPQIMRALTS